MCNQNNKYSDPNFLMLEIWKEAQSQQKNFNDLLFRIRNIAFVFTGSILVFSGAVIRFNQDSEINKIYPIIGIILLIACVPWLSLYILDRYYYHILLRGSVKISKEIEEKYFKTLNIPLLSKEIIEINRNHKVLFFLESGGGKVTLFYGLPMTIMLIIGLSLLGKTNFVINILIGIILLTILFFCDVQDKDELKLD